MHVLADLSAGTNGCPGINHGAFADIRTNVDVRGHQNGILTNKGAAARDGWGYDPKATLDEIGLSPVLKLAGYFVVKLGKATGRHDFIVFQAEGQQDCLFNPLVDFPLPNGTALSNANTSPIEAINDGTDGIADFCGNVPCRQVGSVVPGLFDNALW